jgi:iron complex transport system permease protein
MVRATDPAPGTAAKQAGPAQAGDTDRQSEAGLVRGWWWWLVGVLALAILTLLSLGFGRYPLSPFTLLHSVVGAVIPSAGGHLTLIDRVVLIDIRLPLVLGALAVGAALSASGAAYQSMFRNPLVSPDILGVSAGAGVGASLGLFYGLPFTEVQILAFLGGIGALLVSVAIAQMIGRGSTVVLVLAGLVVGAMAQAVISLTQYFANPTTTLPRIVFFLLGSLDNVTLSNLWLPGILIVVCIVALYLLRWPITVLAAGEEQAQTLGVSRRLVWGTVIVTTALMTASVVSIAGIVGWVGLVVPHLARFIVGPSFGKLLPASLLIGAFFLLAVEDLDRSVSSIEFPLGVLTALIGAPFFVALLARARRQWD